MAKTPTDTGSKICVVCGNEFTRKHYEPTDSRPTGRWEDIDRFEERETCGDADCLADLRSRRSIRRRLVSVSDSVQVWLSTHCATIHSVRVKK